MERFKITRFGSEKITFADWCVTCCQNDSGIRELQKNLREMQKSPLQKYREVFQFTRDANGFGDFSRNEYFARLTRGRNIGTDLWRTFTDSKYSLRFKLKPEEFLEAALNVAANKDEKILFVETKGEHGRIDTIPGDPLYKDFWGLGRSTRSSAHSKAKTVEVWTSLVENYERLKRYYGDQTESQTSLGMKVLDIVNCVKPADANATQLHRSLREKLAVNGGSFGLDLSRLPNRDEWGVWRITVNMMATDEISGMGP